MHIVIATRYLPWPLIEGGRAAQYRTLEALRHDCRFTLVAPIYSQEEAGHVETLSRKFPNVTVEAVRCFRAPPPRFGRAGLNAAARKLAKTVLPSPPATLTAPAGDSSPYYPFDSLNADVVAAIENQILRGCDLLQIEFAEMLTLGPLFTGRVPMLFVHHQLHFMHTRRFLEANRVTSAHARYLAERMAREENAYLETFDSAIVFSEVDRRELRGFCPGLAVNVSPFPTPDEPLPEPQRFHGPCPHFVMVANAGPRQNVDGLRWFMKEVWPAIKQRLPGAVIEVIGKWSPENRAALPNHADIRFAGFVPDLRGALQSRIMIVPIWVASGIRTKILAAWSASCPVVTTTIGAEGLPGKSGEEFIVADEAGAFASACVELSQDVNRLGQLAANGLSLVKKDYSLQAVRDIRLGIYRKLLASRPGGTK